MDCCPKSTLGSPCVCLIDFTLCDTACRYGFSCWSGAAGTQGPVDQAPHPPAPLPTPPLCSWLFNRHPTGRRQGSLSDHTPDAMDTGYQFCSRSQASLGHLPTPVVGHLFSSPRRGGMWPQVPANADCVWQPRTPGARVTPPQRLGFVGRMLPTASPIQTREAKLS